MSEVRYMCAHCLQQLKVVNFGYDEEKDVFKVFLGRCPCQETWSVQNLNSPRQNQQLKLPLSPQSDKEKEKGDDL